MKIHIVQKGDTLWKIAKKYGVDFEELKKMNAQLSNPDMIMPGMKIKVPSSGHAVKKEMPHHKPHAHKEAPHHHKPHVHKEAPKAVHPPKKEMPKEMPQKIYQPIMPMAQSLPEIDINNYYMMNMSQTQAQVQQQAPPPKEEPIVAPAVEEVPMPMPVQECPPPMEYCYYAPPMPICDPCYPYPQHMMPYYAPGMAYPHAHMPMYGNVPAVMPAQEYMAPYGQWGEESSTTSSYDMTYHHGHHHSHHSMPYGQMGDEWDDPVMPAQEMTQPIMPPGHGYYPQYGGYPAMQQVAGAEPGGFAPVQGPPAYPFYSQQMMPGMQPFTHMPMQPAYPYGLPGTAAPYAMPVREQTDEEEDG